MIQDLIPGGGEQQFAYCAFFKDGRAMASMVVRRRRQHPPEFGRASTFVEAIELPILETLSERFLRAINYYGLVELEYKLDPRDGQYKLLDVNGRTWGYHTLGSGAGVDFPYLLFADQMGEADRAAPRTRRRELDPARHGPADRDRRNAGTPAGLAGVLAVAEGLSGRGRLQPRGSAAGSRWSCFSFRTCR